MVHGAFVSRTLLLPSVHVGVCYRQITSPGYKRLMNRVLEFRRTSMQSVAKKFSRIGNIERKAHGMNVQHGLIREQAKPRGEDSKGSFGLPLSSLDPHAQRSHLTAPCFNHLFGQSAFPRHNVIGQR